MIYIKFKNQEIEISSKGVLYSCLAGFFVGLAEVLTFFVFGKGTPASVATPVIIGGSVAVAAILGILVLREQLTLIQGLGTLLIIGGVVLLSLNSGGH
ncbi:EamA-like transporter family protein [compost metagenome]